MPVITHMKIQGSNRKCTEGTGNDAGGHGSRSRNVADIYPTWLVRLVSGPCLFQGGQRGGREATLRRFADPVLRKRIADEIERGIKARILTPENIYVASHQRQFAEYMKEANAGAGETIDSHPRKGESERDNEVWS